MSTASRGPGLASDLTVTVTWYRLPSSMVTTSAAKAASLTVAPVTFTGTLPVRLLTTMRLRPGCVLADTDPNWIWEGVTCRSARTTPNTLTATVLALG